MRLRSTDDARSVIADRSRAGLALAGGGVSWRAARGQARVVDPARRVAARRRRLAGEGAGVIQNATLFRIYASLRGRDRTIRAGTYQFKRGAVVGRGARRSARRQGTRAQHHDPRGVVARARSCRSWRGCSSAPVDSVQAAVRDTALLHRLDIPTRDARGLPLSGHLRLSGGHDAAAGGARDGGALPAGVAAGVERAAAEAGDEPARRDGAGGDRREGGAPARGAAGDRRGVPATG